MGGPVGGALSAVSKKTRIGGEGGVSILDPLQIGPAMFDKVEPAAPKPPPPPADEAAAIFREIARARMDRELGLGQGRARAFGQSPMRRPGGGLVT